MKSVNSINFKEITLEDKKLYEPYLTQGSERGCEFSFASLYLWGRQKYAVLQDQFLVFSQMNHQSVYLYPMGNGNKKEVLDAIIEDAKKRGIPCRISGVYDLEKKTLEELYPGMFQFQYDPGLFDYVYDIDALADLKGKKYHKKRNHIHRFLDSYPDYTVEPLSEENLPRVRRMVAQWYEKRLQDSDENVYALEQEALEKAFRHHRELEMEGLVLLNGKEVLAVTLGSQLSEDTLDVHFEKACPDVNGAYAMINREFARYIRDKYPKIRFFNREEDMGLEGLRKAKQSYYPHHLVEKGWAYLREEYYEDS